MEAQNLITEELTPGVSELELRQQTVEQERNRLLRASDYKLMPDYEQSEAQLQAWRDYRKALRTITEQPSYIENGTAEFPTMSQ